MSYLFLKFFADLFLCGSGVFTVNKLLLQILRQLLHLIQFFFQWWSVLFTLLQLKWKHYHDFVVVIKDLILWSLSQSFNIVWSDTCISINVDSICIWCIVITCSFHTLSFMTLLMQILKVAPPFQSSYYLICTYCHTTLLICLNMADDGRSRNIMEYFSIDNISKKLKIQSFQS